jgi:hypothetical protein
MSEFLYTYFSAMEKVPTPVYYWAGIGCGGRAPRRARPGGVGGLNRHIETAQGLAPVTKAVKAGLGAQFLPH